MKFFKTPNQQFAKALENFQVALKAISEANAYAQLAADHAAEAARQAHEVSIMSFLTSQYAYQIAHAVERDADLIRILGGK